MSGSMNIRIYRSEDCREIVELFYNTVHSVNIKDYNKNQVDVWAPKEIDISSWDKSLLEHYSVVVEKDNVIIGFGDLDETGYFDRLYVHKNYQGMGVATLIADKLEEYAEENNIKTISTHASITAKTFFEKRGYDLIREQKVERKGQFLTNYVMEKNF